MKPFSPSLSDRPLRCSVVRDQISPYLDQRLTGEEMLVVQQHLQDCPQCAQECEDVWLAKSLLRSLSSKEPAPYLEARLSHRLHYSSSGRDRWMADAEMMRPPRGRRLATAMAFSFLVVLTVAAPFAPSVHDASPVLSSSMSELPEPAFPSARIPLRGLFSLNAPTEPNWTPGAKTPARSIPRGFSLPPPLTLPSSLPDALQEQAHGIFPMRHWRAVGDHVHFVAYH